MWDVDGLLTSISSRQLAEWMVYESLEPFGSMLQDAHFAQLDAIMTSTKHKPQEPSKFRLWRTLEEKKGFDPMAWFDGMKRLSVKK